MTTLEMFTALVPAIRGIDSGCDGCIRSFLQSAQEAFPEVPFDDLVWNKCEKCGKTTESVTDKLCWDCEAPRAKPSAKTAQIVANAWEAYIGAEPVIGANYDELFRKLK